MATTFTLPWGKPWQEQAALCGEKLLAAGPGAAGPVICLHPPEAVTGLLALPLSSAVTRTVRAMLEPALIIVVFSQIYDIE